MITITKPGEEPKIVDEWIPDYIRNGPISKDSYNKLIEILGLDVWGVTIEAHTENKDWYANPRKTRKLIDSLYENHNREDLETLCKQLGCWWFPEKRTSHRGDSWQDWDWQEASQHPATWHTFGD